MISMIKEKATSVAAKLSTEKGNTSTNDSSNGGDAAAQARTHSEANFGQDAPGRDLAWAREQEYLLRVSAGPAYDTSTHTILDVNGVKSLCIENESIKANLKVYIRNYNGLPLSSASLDPDGQSSSGSSSTSAYFNASSRKDTQYSIAFNFVPKRDIDADTATWGIEHDEPVRDRLPPGFNLAVKLVKTVVDPSIDLDGYADRPWMYAPALTSWFTWRAGEKKSSQEWEEQGLPDIDDKSPLAEGGGEFDTALREKLSIPTDGEGRKKHFRSADSRRAFNKFEAGTLYQADFFNAYIDFADFAVCLPGMKIHCLKYINDKTHRLKWVFKDGRDGELLFCIFIELLHGQQLRQALNEEAERLSSTHESHELTGAAQSSGTSVEQQPTEQSASSSRERDTNVPDEQRIDIDNVDPDGAKTKLKELAM